MKNEQASLKMSIGKDAVSRVLLIGAIVLYSVSLVLLANLAIASGTENTGALIKVNNQLDGDAFHSLNINVKSVNGNILATEMAAANFARLNNVKGVCASHPDNIKKGAESDVNGKEVRAKYAGADVIIGILDNSGTINGADMSLLQKIEKASNVGFISYVSNDPSSNVIMRNLTAGESNLVQALAYMQQYAKTVNKPLVIEMNLLGAELMNPLFVQVCQKIADSGVQFLGNSFGTGSIHTKAPVQLAFTMFNAETGQITDRSDFWAITEVKDQEIILLGSDANTCRVHFQTESGFDKVYMSNSSDDIVMVTALTAEGEVNYYHVMNRETALIPRVLRNGTPVLEDGLAGIYPYHTKMAMFNGAVAKNQFVQLSQVDKQLEMSMDSGMNLSIGSPSERTLAMSLNNLSAELQIEIKDENGETVYLNRPDSEAKSLQTKIDLSDGAEGLYFLDLTSPQFHQTFALLMD